MTRSRTAALAIALVLAVGAFFLLRGEDSPPPEKRATNKSLADAAALGSLDAEAELERRSQALEDDEEKAGAKAPTSKIDAIDRKRDAIDDLAWRAFDKQFRRTPFDKVVDELPLRKPPLHVQQWVLDSPTDKLRTKAERERFYRMPERKREAIVKAFYASGTHKLYARVDRERFYGMSVRARGGREGLLSRRAAALQAGGYQRLRAGRDTVDRDNGAPARAGGRPRRLGGAHRTRPSRRRRLLGREAKGTAPPARRTYLDPKGLTPRLLPVQAKSKMTTCQVDARTADSVGLRAPPAGSGGREGSVRR